MTDAMASAVVIGASAGAVEALSTILPALSEDYRLPIMVVVHVPPDRRNRLAELFAAKCRVKVCEAADKEPVCAGTVYFAPPDYHLLVERNGTLSLSCDDPVLYSRPSIDVLFESAADAYGASLVAVVLTGANHDGAAGAKAVIEAGGRVVVQQPRDAHAQAMPAAAIAKCPGAEVLSLGQIAAYLQEL